MKNLFVSKCTTERILSNLTLEEIKSLSPNGIGAAKLFAILFHDVIYYDPLSHFFLYFDGKNWKRDHEKLVVGKLVIDFVQRTQDLIHNTSQNYYYANYYYSLANVNKRNELIKDIKITLYNIQSKRAKHGDTQDH